MMTTNRRKVVGVGAALACGLVCMLLGAPAEAKQRAPALRFVGYQVVVEPAIQEEATGRLMTTALRWRLRVVYHAADGRQIVATPQLPAKYAGNIRDTEVRINRAWTPLDHPRASPVYRDFRKAVTRFNKVRTSDDITLLAAAAPDGPGPLVIDATKGPKPPAPPAVEDKKKKKKKKPDCEGTLLELGHHPSNLKLCRGANPACAVALLKAGQQPNHLASCRAVLGRCAVALLKAGHHPSHLDRCTVDLRPRCAVALLKAGHHPSHLDACSGVAADCAVKLLKAGHHPSHLSECRR